MTVKKKMNFTVQMKEVKTLLQTTYGFKLIGIKQIVNKKVQLYNKVRNSSIKLGITFVVCSQEGIRCLKIR